MLDKMHVNEFINELASNSPAPGGGSVAALCGSLGAALTSMVFNLTVGKKAYLALGDEERASVDAGLVKANDLKDDFLRLMNEDTQVFNKLMAAFKMPKETEEEKGSIPFYVRKKRDTARQKKPDAVSLLRLGNGVSYQRTEKPFSETAGICPASVRLIWI